MVTESPTQTTEAGSLVSLGFSTASYNCRWSLVSGERPKYVLETMIRAGNHTGVGQTTG